MGVVESYWEGSSLGRVVSHLCVPLHYRPPASICLQLAVVVCANHLSSLTRPNPFLVLRTFPRVSEERCAHDLEYPDIPSIPEEQEEDVLSTPSR